MAYVHVKALPFFFLCKSQLSTYEHNVLPPLAALYCMLKPKNVEERRSEDLDNACKAWKDYESAQIKSITFLPSSRLLEVVVLNTKNHNENNLLKPLCNY